MKKNNNEVLEKMKGLLDNLQDFQYKWFVDTFYLKSDIKTFADEFKKLEPEINIINGRTPNEKESRMIELWGKFQVLKQLFETKKFMESKTDIIVISDLLLDMAKECKEIGGIK